MSTEENQSPFCTARSAPSCITPRSGVGNTPKIALMPIRAIRARNSSRNRFKSVSSLIDLLPSSRPSESRTGANPRARISRICSGVASWRDSQSALGLGRLSCFMFFNTIADTALATDLRHRSTVKCKKARLENKSPGRA